ncbi:MAG TPA: tRNA 2-selenouridine(34) synthase MnmH [Pseudobacteroides sp.]|uniref:tRNA 2-selenouridine(34) synthase MnmH n=1 Tax=Pseudobacteroides sp. TaxID=1968840 RepID=UPI002F91C1E0
MMTHTYNDYEKIVLNKTPLIDVRAPIEFIKGAFLNAVNLPLMNDEERRLVGICYKEKGSDEAIRLGHKLVSGKTRLERIEAWASHLEKYPDSLVYCFRGGLRSTISQQWIIEETGKEILRLNGGYKAFRNYLINALIPSQHTIPVLLGGFTGSGKTHMLKNLRNSIDLEGLAKHRGSSFGRYINPQPTQIDFENNLAYDLIRHRHKGHNHLIVEDEGVNIGRCIIPKQLFLYFKTGNLILIDLPFEERLLNTVDEYVFLSQAEYVKVFGQEQGLLKWAEYIEDGINRIKKRLGGDLFKRVTVSFDLALNKQQLTCDCSLHSNWIEILLKEYYDPMYRYQIETTGNKIMFRGSTKEVLEFLKAIN